MSAESDTPLDECQNLFTSLATCSGNTFQLGEKEIELVKNLIKAVHGEQLEEPKSYLGGLVCWLDAADEHRVRKDENDKVAAWISKIPNESGQEMKYSRGTHGPELKRDKFGVPLISFDYERFLVCPPSKSWVQCRTMISVHTWRNRCGSTKPNNFYIFSGDSRGPFHCDKEDKLYSGHGVWSGAGGKYFHNGTIRRNGNDAVLVKETETWREELSIATMQSFESRAIPDFANPRDCQIRINRIGRDRVYHEFLGDLGEVMVWNRALEEEEIEEVEFYLFKKWFGWSLTLIPDFFTDTDQQLILDFAFGIGHYFLKAKQEMLKKLQN